MYIYIFKKFFISIIIIIIIIFIIFFFFWSFPIADFVSEEASISKFVWRISILNGVFWNGGLDL